MDRRAQAARRPSAQATRLPTAHAPAAHALLMVSVVAFLVTSVLCGLSTSMPMLIAVRAVQGVAAGGLMALGSAASGDLFSPRERGRYSGYSAAVFGGTTVVGPVLGGVLTDTLGWQAIC